MTCIKRTVFILKFTNKGDSSSVYSLINHEILCFNKMAVQNLCKSYSRALRKHSFGVAL